MRTLFHTLAMVLAISTTSMGRFNGYQAWADGAELSEHSGAGTLDSKMEHVSTTPQICSSGYPPRTHPIRTPRSQVNQESQPASLQPRTAPRLVPVPVRKVRSLDGPSTQLVSPSHIRLVAETSGKSIMTLQRHDAEASRLQPPSTLVSENAFDEIGDADMDDGFDFEDDLPVPPGSEESEKDAAEESAAMKAKAEAAAAKSAGNGATEEHGIDATVPYQECFNNGYFSPGPDGYGIGPCEAGPYGAGPYGAGPYEAGPYEAGPYEAGPYEAGPYEAGPYGAGPYGAGPYGAGHYGAGHYGAGHYGAGHFEAGHYGAGHLEGGHYGAAGPTGAGKPSIGPAMPCLPQGIWWEATPPQEMGLSAVVRQIELHPGGTYNEVIYHRSGVRVDVVIGSFLLQRGELTLLVEGMPQARSIARDITVGGQPLTVAYRLGSSGPYVLAFNHNCSQLVLTDASGASRVWMRYPPPHFGVPSRARGYYAPGRPGYGNYHFPWLPNGAIE